MTNRAIAQSLFVNQHTGRDSLLQPFPRGVPELLVDVPEEQLSRQG